MIQDNIEHSTFITSRRAANIYIKPILGEESLINTPSLLPEYPSKNKQSPINLINNHHQHLIKKPESHLQIQETFLNLPMTSQFERVIKFYSFVYIAYHSFISIYFLTLLFQNDKYQLLYLRNIGVIMAGIHQIIAVTYWKQQNNFTKFLLNLFGRDSYTFIMYLLSFIFPCQISFFYVFISLLYYPTLYKTIRICLIIMLQKNGKFIIKNQFILAEIFVLIYVIHLNASFIDALIEIERNELSSTIFYLKTINASFKALLMSYEGESILFFDQLMVTLNIVFALTYYFSILIRFQTYKLSNFNSPQFETFINDELIKDYRGQFQIMKTLWNAYELNQDQVYQFREIIDQQRQLIYFDKIVKCQTLSNLFSKNLLHQLAKSAEIIKLQKHQLLKQVGLSIVVKGLLRIKLSDHLQIKEQLKPGNIFGLIDFLTNENQGLQLDCISEQCTVLHIPSSSFNEIIDNYLEDKEIFRLIKDDIINYNNTHLIDQKCYFCGMYHSSKRCPNTFIHSIANVLLLQQLRNDQTNHRVLHSRERQRKKTYLKGTAESQMYSEPDSSESYFQDPVSEIVTPIPDVGKPYSMLQLFPCSSKGEPEQSPPQNHSHSNYLSSNFQVAESQSIKKETNILSFKSLEPDHVNFNVDAAHNFKYYYPNYNAELVIDILNSKVS